MESVGSPGPQKQGEAAPLICHAPFYTFPQDPAPVCNSARGMVQAKVHPIDKLWGLALGAVPMTHQLGVNWPLPLCVTAQAVKFQNLQAHCAKPGSD